MPAPKSRRGGAYITTLAATMLIIMLATVVLSVTATSRRLTARYSDYIGLYDLAVAGNEQAFLLLTQTLNAQKASIVQRSWGQLQSNPLLGFVNYNGNLRLDAFSGGEFRRIFIEEAMSDLRAAMDSNFSRYFFMYQLTWGLDAAIDTGGHTIADTYRAITTLCAVTNHIFMDTVIRRYDGDDPGTQAIVEASIIWTDTGYREVAIDTYTIYTLESNGIVFPNPPINGEYLILFLDEFTLAMVESLRIQIGIHEGRREAWGC